MDSETVEALKKITARQRCMNVFMAAASPPRLKNGILQKTQAQIGSCNGKLEFCDVEETMTGIWVRFSCGQCRGPRLVPLDTLHPDARPHVKQLLEDMNAADEQA